MPTITFGVDTNDPANAMFTTGELRRRVDRAAERRARTVRDAHRPRHAINGELRLDEDTDEYQYLGLGMQRARLRD